MKNIIKIIAITRKFYGVGHTSLGLRWIHAISAGRTKVKLSVWTQENS